ncbi:MULTISPECIES: hypothetical protein [unclassified Xanthomonas]|uniref:hypothetical protein n=1 Tax=unclassified Xanthomonas TaxID=2643310 RepID=UPI0028830420|nr:MULTISPECIES: hypothetical protein [unclassified Xanthomonas]
MNNTCNANCLDLTACQLHEALMMAGDPEFDREFDDRSRVRIFYSEKGHSGAGLYCECVDAEEEGCILLDGSSPAIRGTASASAPAPEDAFQAGVSTWMGECFLPSLYADMTERGDRLLEEVLELLQSNGYDQTRVATLVDYVYGRPVGEPAQEVGGVMVTLAGYCMVAGLDMHAEGARELVRIMQPEVMTKIRRKQEAKNALHFDTPLPGNAGHPQPAAAVPITGVQAIATERARQVLVEGMTPEGDAGYRYGQLAWAAVAYVQLTAMDLQAGGRQHIATGSPPACWPWDAAWWKPRDAHRDLVRAGALIAAQIDFIDQQNKQSKSQEALSAAADIPMIWMTHWHSVVGARRSHRPCAASEDSPCCAI